MQRDDRVDVGVRRAPWRPRRRSARASHRRARRPDCCAAASRRKQRVERAPRRRRRAWRARTPARQPRCRPRACPGPRPLATMASRSPCGMRPSARMRAAAKSCVYVRTRTVPARASAASNTRSGGSTARRRIDGGACSCERPAFSTTTGLVRAAMRSADMNARASPTRFDVQQDAVGGRVVHERIEQLAEPDVDPRAERDDGREADVAAAPRSRASPCTPRPIAQRARAARSRERRAERRVESDIRAHHAECARDRARGCRCARRGDEDIALPCVRRRVVALGIWQQDRSLAPCRPRSRGCRGSRGDGVAMTARSTGSSIRASDANTGRPSRLRRFGFTA